MKKIVIGSLAAISVYSTLVYAAQTITQDLVVQGSECVGIDCVSSESFGFDTLRLKENNLRIKFQDTSNSASFPSNDWQLTANDSTNGGQNKFSIDDIDGAKTPFTIEAGARSHSLYVDDGGRIGIGTSTPVTEAHIVDGDSPTLRLEQNGSSGFTAQTWDLAGNETNFFVRDASNGSSLPFRIRPGSGTNNALYIDSDGDIGLGDTTPTAALDIEAGAISQPVLRLSSTTSDYSLRIEDDDDPSVLFAEGSDDTNHYRIGVSTEALNGFGFYSIGVPRRHFVFQPNGNFFLHTSENKVNDMWAMKVDINSQVTFGGDVEVVGTFTNTSSRKSKHNIQSVIGTSILDKLSNLDISTWQYITDSTQALHIGPMAEDFFSVFKLGKNEKTISPMDTAGVSLAAIKELNEQVKSQQQEIDELKKIINDLIESKK